MDSAHNAIAERFVDLLAAEINEGRHEYAYVAVTADGDAVLDGAFDPTVLYDVLRRVHEGTPT